MEKKKTYLASVSYDGSSFNGWARQTGLFTVQGFIEKTMTSVFLLDSFKILASSRTDKGVHALDQNFTFALPSNIPCERLPLIFAKSLRDLVKLNRLKEVSSAFHPLYSVQLKEYRYYINMGEYNLFLNKYCWNYNLGIDFIKLRKLLKIFEGFHDFFNFSYCRARNQAKKNTWREIKKISVSKDEDLLIIRIFAKGFLRYQIRAMIGETLAVLGNSEAYEILSKMLLSTQFPQKYKRLAPAGGLYLWKITFKD